MRTFLLLFSLLLSFHVTSACDFCNCYLGINPHYKKNAVGLRATSSKYEGSHMNQTELENNDLTASDFKELRANFEIIARYYPIQKLQVQLFAPYVVNIESMSDNAFSALSGSSTSSNRISHADHATATTSSVTNKSNTVQGIGDPIVMAQFQIFNLNATDSNSIQHRLFAGGGIKIPLGRSLLLNADEPLEKSHQPGTGSWDMLPAVSYLAKYKKLGVNANITYLISGKDRYKFRQSDRINANLNLYREFGKKDFKYFPSLGLYFEQAGKTKYGALLLDKTGGSLILGHLGIDFYYRKFSVNMAAHLPAMQQLNGSQPNLTYRLIAGISYALN